MKTLKKIIVSCFITLSATYSIYAQASSEDKSLLSQINEENKSAINSIAMYPEGMRTTIFNACQYPEIIVRLSSMQKKTNADFTEMLSPYSKEEQEKIWNLTRYPDLISKLSNGSKKSESEINAITEAYPKDVQEAAILEGTKNYDLLTRIDQSNKKYNTDFEQMLKEYPASATIAFKELLKQPAILAILSDNMHMTIVVGDLYKQHPELVIHNADSINFVLTEKNKLDAADWQKSLETNPTAKLQYEQAAKEYAQENGYQTQQYAIPNQNDLMYYNSYSYNWWFGYPSWYGYSYWVPYPYWYDWGFYYGPSHRMHYYGMPSARFFNWYWYRNENHYHYSEFSSHCYGYYNNHHGAYSYNPVCRGVHDWRNKNHGLVGKSWDGDNSHRVVLFKEYGQMEMGRAKYNASNPQQAISNQEYLKMNHEKYPSINSAAQNIHEQNVSKPQETYQNNQPLHMENKPVNIDQRNIQPQVNNPQTVQPDVRPQYNNPSQQTTVQPQYNNPQTHQPEVRPQYNNPSQQTTVQPQVQHYNTQPQTNPQQSYPQQQHNAIEYHQNSWQQSQPAQPATRPSYQAAPSRPTYQPSAPAQSRPSFSAPARPAQTAPARPSGGSFGGGNR